MKKYISFKRSQTYIFIIVILIIIGIFMFSHSKNRERFEDLPDGTEVSTEGFWGSNIQSWSAMEWIGFILLVITVIILLSGFSRILPM